MTMNKEEVLELVNRRERQILVHSYLYYERDVNIWPDYKYDAACKELTELIKLYPEVAKEAQWSNVYSDFDGSTGVFLPIKHPWVVSKGEQLYRSYMKEHE